MCRLVRCKCSMKPAPGLWRYTINGGICIYFIFSAVIENVNNDNE